MEIMIISALSMVLVFLAFIVGLHYGSKVRKGETIEMVNPVKAVKEYVKEEKLEKQRDKEQQIEEINLANIDSYNGTELGQKEFPNN